MRDSYRSISISELTNFFESLPLDERKKLMEQANILAPFLETIVDSSNYKLICKIIETLQSHGDPNPMFIKPDTKSSYPLNMCNVNTGHFLSQNKNYKLVRGFKVYQAVNNTSKEVSGFKAVVHFVTVNKQGTYYDPTPDDDSEYLFVPSSRVYPSEDDKTFWTRGIKLSAIVYGDDEYKNYVFSDSKLQNAGHDMIFEKPENMVVLKIVEPGSEVTINGLKSRSDLNGKKITLGNFNIEKRRWEVSIDGKIILLDHSNIT